MKGERIPGADHVSRYCGGAAVGTGACFLLRQGESYLSINWLEHLKLTSRAQEIAEVRRVLSAKLTLGSRARIAVLNVKQTTEYVRSESPDNRDLLFLHEPESPTDESHSGIYNSKSDHEMLIAELIAETIVEDHPAR